MRFKFFDILMLWGLLVSILAFRGEAQADPAAPYYKDEYVIKLDAPGCVYPGEYSLAKPCPKNGYEAGWHLVKLHKGKLYVDPKNLPQEITYDEVGAASATVRMQNIHPGEVTLNYFYKAYGAPNDPGFKDQWHHKAIKSQVGWKRFKKPRLDTVAVLDTGTDCNHPDITCVPGYDAIKNTANWTGTDGNGHGTHVAGIIGAVRNNAAFVTGISSVNILPVKVLNDAGAGSFFTIIRGFDWAVAQGVKVINMSLGGSMALNEFRQAIDRAVGKGVFVVAAAGNEHANLKYRPSYPCMYDGVYCVAATTKYGGLAGFSNFGVEKLIRAPGDQILSTFPGGGMKVLSGTSMATPMVAGAIALTGKAPKKLLRFKSTGEIYGKEE